MQDVKEYVTTCEECIRAKALRRKYGQLSPNPIPTKPWTHITMDFIVKLPLSGQAKYDSILVVVDRFTKIAYYILTYKSINTRDFAKIILREIIRLHSLLKHIISNRAGLFISNF